MTDLVNDMSILTTIPVKTLNKLVRKSIYCICDTIVEDRLADEDISSIDLGIGILYIKHTGNSGEGIKYHFEPNSALDKAVKNTIINDKNLLEDLILTNLNEKFMDAYKDLC